MAARTEDLNVGPRDHVVQFYGRDEELAESVSGYLLAAIQDGGVAIVIATAAHRREFGARLADAGIDVAAALSSGAYRPFDAGKTMRRFVVAGRPDPVRFELVISRLIQQAVQGGGPVRVYGEMVALLWDAGFVSAAIELETMWNELGRQWPFSLLCGYPAHSVTGDDHLSAFGEVCRLHAAVVGVAPAGVPARHVHGEAAAETRVFAASSSSPRAARRFVVETLRRWGAGTLAGDAALVVTELATNAVVHARSDFTVAISAPGRNAVRISVCDANELSPADLHSPLVAVPARGLGAVAAAASSWGTEPADGGGKAVWAELRGPAS